MPLFSLQDFIYFYLYGFYADNFYIYSFYPNLSTSQHTPILRPLNTFHLDTQLSHQIQWDQNTALSLSFIFFSKWISFQLYHFSQGTHLVSQLRKFEDIFHFSLLPQPLWLSCHKITPFLFWNVPGMYPYSPLPLLAAWPSLYHLRPPLKRLLCGALWLYPVLSLCLLAHPSEFKSKNHLKSVYLLAPKLYPVFSNITPISIPPFLPILLSFLGISALPFPNICLPISSSFFKSTYINFKISIMFFKMQELINCQDDLIQLHPFPNPSPDPNLYI